MNLIISDFIYSSTEVLNIRGNGFEGRLIPELSTLTKLRELNLQFNQFSGELPTSIGDLSFLSKLFL